MVNQVKASPVALEMAAAKLVARNERPVEEKAAVKSVKTDTGAKAAPSLSELNAKAFLQRQQIGAALYDRSFTFGEGIRALKRQDAIASYAAQIAAKEGGPTEKDLAKLDRKLDRADGQIARLSNNGRGADLDSLEAIDGKELDTVQENLMNRIKAGIKDGSLTEDEAKGLLARQDELNKVEVKLRESDGKLTAGEQKQLLDQLRKEADQLNRLRHNNVGVNLTYKSYSDQIDARQASLEKQLEAGIKLGSLTENEVAKVKAELETANTLEAELRQDGRVDWRDATKMSTALNNAEIALYELQRNKQGVQLKDSFVDVKHVDQRQAQQLESLSRGISNRSLNDNEGIELLEGQRDIANQETRFLKDDGKLDRSEFLRLQNSMNDFALRNQELQSNKDRWTGLFPAAGLPGTNPAPAPVKPTPTPAEPPKAADPAPATPAPAPSAPAPIAPTPVAVAPSPAPAPAPAPAPQPEQAPAAPVKAEEPKKPEEPKSETKVEDNGKGGDAPAVISTGNAAPKAGKVEVLGDRFGEMVTGMLKQLGEKVNGIGEEIAEKAREKADEMKDRATETRTENLGFGDARVKLYTKLDKATAAATDVVRKVA